MKNRRRNTRPDDRARTRILCYGEVCRGALGLYSTWSRLTYCALRNTDQQNSISGSQNACKSVGIKLPHTLLVYSNNPRAKKWLKRALPDPILKCKLNMQLYVEVTCGRQKPPQGSVWAAGLHEEPGERVDLLSR